MNCQHYDNGWCHNEATCSLICEHNYCHVKKIEEQEKRIEKLQACLKEIKEMAEPIIYNYPIGYQIIRKVEKVLGDG